MISADIKIESKKKPEKEGNLEENNVSNRHKSSPQIDTNKESHQEIVTKEEKVGAASEKAEGEKGKVESGEKKKETTPAEDSHNVVLDFQKVSKIYQGNIKAVDDVSFKIKIGEFVSLVGPSGAGKSTLIRLLTREELPTSGRIYVAGRDITQLKFKELPYFRRKVGIIFQDFKLLPKKTIFENVAFALEVAGISDAEIRDKVPKMIEIVGLTSRIKALSEELSGGEKQRVSIARALIHRPKILIADEPTGNLDPVTTWEIIELLFKINRQGTIVLLATHDKEVVDALQRRVVTMRDGKIVGDQMHGKYIL
jgi:cell division transport system ATP-binding protein